MSDNGKDRKIIFKAEVIDNKIVTETFSKHVPTLAYIESMIQAEKIKLIISEKAKEEAKNAPMILNPMKTFLNRRR